MRWIKMSGLATLVALVAMAFLGATSAMAEPEHPEIVLCEKRGISLRKHRTPTRRKSTWRR